MNRPHPPPHLAGLVSAKISSVSGHAAEYIPYHVTLTVDAIGYANMSFTREDLDETETRMFKLAPTRRIELKAKGSFHSVHVSSASGVTIKLNFTSRDTQQKWHSVLKQTAVQLSPRHSASIFAKKASSPIASPSQSATIMPTHSKQSVFDWAKDIEHDVYSSTELPTFTNESFQRDPTYTELIGGNGNTIKPWDLMPPPPPRNSTPTYTGLGATPPALPPRPPSLTPVMRASKEIIDDVPDIESITSYASKPSTHATSVPSFGTNHRFLQLPNTSSSQPSPLRLDSRSPSQSGVAVRVSSGNESMSREREREPETAPLEHNYTSTTL